MNTGESLYAACLASPNEDTPRLALADWLDEQDEVEIVCPRCAGKGWYYDDDSGCNPCAGTGTVLDRSNAARAELIRYQVTLARLPKCSTPSIGLVVEGKAAPCYMCRPRHKRDCIPWCENCCKREDLMNRERELLAIARTWERLPCPECEKSAELTRVREAFAGPCPVCSSTGDVLRFDRHTDSRQMGLWTPYIVHWIRGFPVVECTSAEVWRNEPCPKRDPKRDLDDRLNYRPHWDCSRCKGTQSITQPTHWACAVGRWAVGFRLTDRQVWEQYTNFGNGRWTAGAGSPGDNNELPAEIFELVANPEVGWPYPTREAAVAALDAAVAMWVRKAVQS